MRRSEASVIENVLNSLRWCKTTVTEGILNALRRSKAAIIERILNSLRRGQSLDVTLVEKLLHLCPGRLDSRKNRIGSLGGGVRLPRWRFTTGLIKSTEDILYELERLVLGGLCVTFSTGCFGGSVYYVIDDLADLVSRILENLERRLGRRRRAFITFTFWFRTGRPERIGIVEHLTDLIGSVLEDLKRWLRTRGATFITLCWFVRRRTIEGICVVEHLADLIGGVLEELYRLTRAGFLLIL